MKLCYLGNANSIHVQRWTNYFAQQGHDVHLITLKPYQGDGFHKDITLYPLTVKRKVGGLKIPAVLRKINLPPVISQIKTLLQQISPDILHAHSVTDNGFFGALSNFHPLVLTAWGSDVLIAPQRSVFLKQAAKYALKKTDFITCDAEHIIEPMIKLGAKKDNIAVIFFGTDVKKFHPQHKNPKFRDKLNLAPDTPAVISLRNLNPIYDVESLIKAVPLVLKEIPEAKFIIVGKGEQKEYLEQLASTLGVINSVDFVGYLPNHELPGYLASMDVYVSTSLSDAGLAASTAEAMACELPVVITDFGNNKDWVTDGDGGFLTPLKTPTILAEKIIFLLQNSEIRENFGKINRKVIKERNNYYTEMAKVESIYQKLIEEYNL